MINKQSVYMVRHGEKKIKKISLKKLINAINHDSWTKTFFIKKDDAKKFVKE